MEFQPNSKWNPPEEKGAKPPVIPVLIANFLIMLAYVIPQPKDLGGSMVIAFCLFVHFVIVSAAGGLLLSTENKHIGKALLKSAVIILLIGFGWCVVRGTI